MPMGPNFLVVAQLSISYRRTLFKKIESGVVRFSQHRNIKTTNLGKSETSLKENLRRYIYKHEYVLGTIRALGFSQDDSTLVPVSESFSSINPYWFFNWFMSTTKTGKVDEKISLMNDMMKTHKYVPTCSSVTIFQKGYEVLDKYINGQELEPPFATALDALERFFNEKENHQLSLSYLQEQNTETAVAALLGQHLLAQLLPYPSNYFLDSHSKKKPDDCPCGCGELIHYGLTYLGSPFLFHGYADIVLFPTNKDLFLELDNSTSAVFTIKKTDDEIYGHRIINNDWNSTEHFDEDISACKCKVDNLGNESHESAVRQLCKQAISTSICKYRRLKDEGFHPNNVSMIPVCAITKNCYEIAVYDAESDYLLKSEPLPLFKDLHTLDIFAVIDLWMLINHSLFCTKPDTETLNILKGTCNLIPQLGKGRFDAVVGHSNWLMSPEHFQTWSLSQLDESENCRIDKSLSKEYPKGKKLGQDKTGKKETYI